MIVLQIILKVLVALLGSTLIGFYVTKYEDKIMPKSFSVLSMFLFLVLLFILVTPIALFIVFF